MNFIKLYRILKNWVSLQEIRINKISCKLCTLLYENHLMELATF